jgi:hypothetical protein
LEKNRTLKQVGSGVPKVYVREIVFKENKGKGKGMPLYAWTGPEGSRSLRFPDFKPIGK